MSTDFLKEGGCCGLVRLGLPAPVGRGPAKESKRTRRIVRYVSTARVSRSQNEARTLRVRLLMVIPASIERTDAATTSLFVLSLPLLEIRIKRCLRRSGGGIVQAF